MSPTAFTVALLAAVLHATWNLIIKTSDDRLVMAAGMTSLSAVIFSPALLVTGVPTEAWRYLILSGLVHTGYLLSLVTAYDRVNFSIAYPVARGMAPVLVAIAGSLLLGDRIGVAGVLALSAVAVGVIWLGWMPGAMSGVRWALLTGAFIATYTILDTAAVRSTGNAFGYTIGALSINALLVAPIAVYRRGWPQVVATITSRPLLLLLASVMSLTGYALVLSAATLAPVGLVSAVRESSVVFGSIAAVLFLKEPMAHRRIAAASLVTAGLVVLGIS